MRAYRSFILSVTATTLIGTTVIIYVAAFHRTEGAYLDADGTRIHYTDQGEGAPVILLHGFGVHSDLNFRLPSAIHLLALDYRVIAVDARAHGLS
jgi:alpha-beta hydrolase superfamily lysophospholipase